MGGEEITRDLKKTYGGSRSDLYYDPKTGDIYAVPRGLSQVPIDDMIGNLSDYGIKWR